MNFRNKYLVITIRTLLGLLFIFSGVSGFISGFNNMEGVPPDMISMTQNLWDTGIFQMIKVTEIVAGLMLVTGVLPALAAIFLAPVCIGILIVNSRIAPSALPLGIVVTLATAYLGYVYWDKYRALFTRA